MHLRPRTVHQTHLGTSARRIWRCRFTNARCHQPSSDALHYYEVLGVDAHSTHHEIKAAFRRSVLRLHPDLHVQSQVDTTAAFLVCKRAYEVLSKQRAHYDAQLAADATSSSSSNSDEASAPQQTSSAAAAAAASSGSWGGNNSSAGGRNLPAVRSSIIPRPGPAADSKSTAAALRFELLERADVALEQFGSLQEALCFLAQLERETGLLGLATEDCYTTAAGSSSASSSSSSNSRAIAAKPDSGAGESKQEHWGAWHPGEFAPVRPPKPSKRGC